MRNLLLALFVFLIAACSKEDPHPPVPKPDSSVTILDLEYGLEKGSYYNGYYEFMKQDCLVFHMELTTPAGITVEISKDLIGKKISFEPLDEFWFFSIGNGTGVFRAFENSKGDFDTYSGWFIADVNERTNECLLEFELIRKEELMASGKIIEVFERIDSL
jgi:hypothetical protein